MARIYPPKSAIGGKVRLQGKIKHPGELNRIAGNEYGKTYFELGDGQRERILRQLKARGRNERQLLGKMQVQLVFHKNMPDHVKAKAEKDRRFISEKLYG